MELISKLPATNVHYKTYDQRVIQPTRNLLKGKVIFVDKVGYSDSKDYGFITKDIQSLLFEGDEILVIGDEHIK
jgi:hypothetical protein